MTSLELQEVSKILGGKKVLRKELHSYFDMIELGGRGITKTALMNLANYLRLSPGQIARLLPVSERTVQRHDPGRPFNRAISEQILHIAEVAAKGTEVFENRENFLAWLHYPNTALASKAPIDLLKSRFGADLVLEELSRMEHGIFS